MLPLPLSSRLLPLQLARIASRVAPLAEVIAIFIGIHRLDGKAVNAVNGQGERKVRVGEGLFQNLARIKRDLHAHHFLVVARGDDHDFAAGLGVNRGDARLKRVGRRRRGRRGHQKPDVFRGGGIEASQLHALIEIVAPLQEIGLHHDARWRGGRGRQHQSRRHIVRDCFVELQLVARSRRRCREVADGRNDLTLQPQIERRAIFPIRDVARRHAKGRRKRVADFDQLQRHRVLSSFKPNKAGICHEICVGAAKNRVTPMTLHFNPSRRFLEPSHGSPPRPQKFLERQDTIPPPLQKIPRRLQKLLAPFQKTPPPFQ